MLRMTAVLAAVWCLTLVVGLYIGHRRSATPIRPRWQVLGHLLWWPAWAVTGAVLALWLPVLLVACPCSPVWSWSAAVALTGAGWLGVGIMWPLAIHRPHQSPWAVRLAVGTAAVATVAAVLAAVVMYGGHRLTIVAIAVVCVACAGVFGFYTRSRGSPTGASSLAAAVLN